MQKDPAKFWSWRIGRRMLVLAMVASLICTVLEIAALPVEHLQINEGGGKQAWSWLESQLVYGSLVLVPLGGLIALCECRRGRYCDYSPRELAVASRIIGVVSLLCCGFLTIPSLILVLWALIKMRCHRDYKDAGQAVPGLVLALASLVLFRIMTQFFRDFGEHMR